jgi:two-component system probable response regulator PhcQ
VDDEELSLKYFSRAFDAQFRIYTGRNVTEGLKLVEEHKENLGILLTDQRMPGGSGTELLEKARQIAPRAVRVLVTAFSDLEAAIQAVNTGAIYKYITKPWDVRELETTMKRALEFYIVQRERDQLLREKLSVLHDLVIRDRVISLGVAASGLGHYVRNSLVAVQTFLDLAPSRLQQESLNIEQLRNQGFWRDFYGHVRSQVDRITEMLQFLGQATESQAAWTTEEVSLGDVINAKLEEVRPQLATRKITSEIQVPADLPRLTVDPVRFGKLFEFLFTEEASNLPEGGHFSLRAVKAAGVAGAGDEVRIEIEDNGPGLPADALRAIFDPFFIRSGDPRQSGIRLMACYFIVHHHNGQIQVKPRPEGGMHMSISLPVLAPTPGPTYSEQEFIQRVLLNDRLWERILAGV